MLYLSRSTLQATVPSYPQVALDQKTLAGVWNLFLPHLLLPVTTTTQSFPDLLLNMAATRKDCTPYTMLLCTARHHQGPGTPPPNSHPCTHMHKAAHCTPRLISRGGRAVPQPLCHPHGQHAAKSPSHNTSLPEEILVAAISNY